MAITIEKIMEQVQVYASAFADVDGTFSYQGEKFDESLKEKACLQEMLEEFQDEVETNGALSGLKDIAEGLIQWHQNRLSNFDTVLSAPADTEVRLDTGGKELLVLNGDRLKGFRIGLTIAREWIDKFPLSIERTAPVSDEEE
ncbi:host nuclease inhibitor protein [Stutzerimonas stutzeri]|uniref:host nuclease inhibitor protein n=1 Tax=Stutzerimonas stutzeri TaxID=316 RepID=UPI001BD0CD03|nr:host nuclease inhibitor protein [Stutzerimonas stutzeri]